jgi:DNA polymerase
MPDQFENQLLVAASAIKEQLKFYRDIGLEDIGGSAVEPASEATSREVSSDNQSSQYAAAVTEPASSAPALDLFGESVAHSSIDSRAKRQAPPLIEAHDSTLDAIREDIGDCQRCRLHEHRRTIVFGEGNPDADLAFVGEGPGAEEDATGRPFVGRAGQLLDKIIGAIGLKREDVYIANIVKCRPPLNRTPERDEVETCEPFLFRQLMLIRPRVIVALGAPAFQCLLRTRESITRARGEWREWNGIKVMPTFHPAFLLRSPDKKREVWEDMKKVRDYLNAE